MPRSNWKGSISFGLVNIPIILYHATDPSEKVSFRQINKKTGSTIKYKRVDAETGKEVAWENIGKGFQYDKETILPIEDGELERVAGDNARTIAIEEFIDKKNIDFVNIEETYYLTPDKKGEKGYVILREALKESNKIGIAKVIISTKEHLAAVSVYNNSLILYLLHYHDELRDLSELNLPLDDIKKYKVTKNEISIAKQLISSMTVKWKPEKFKDEFKKAVVIWVEKKIKKLPTITMKSKNKNKHTTTMVNFVDLLKKSLQSKNVKPRKSTAIKSKRHTAVSHHTRH